MARAKKEKQTPPKAPEIAGMHFLGWSIVDAEGIKAHKTGRGGGMAKVYSAWGRAEGIRKTAYRPDDLIVCPVYIQPNEVVALALTKV
jgi:hypothetical protein